MAEETIWEKEHNEPLMVAVSQDDPAIKEATEEAQASLDVFIDLYEKYNDNLGVFFAIKVCLKDGEDTAHFWFTFKGVKDGKFIGEHFELPEELSHYKTVSVTTDDIEDWMINDHGHLYGGYSIRVMRENLPKNEREKYDAYIGIKVYKENNF